MADLSYTDFFKTQLPDLKLIFGGIGQLLRTCKVKPSGVAIHWSQSSRYGAPAADEFGTPSEADARLIGILKREGILNWDYITGCQLENKPSITEVEKVIFLPVSQCLSEKESATLKRFVKKGGLLVGIGPVGSRNAFGKELTQGLLDTTFGVKMSAPAEVCRIRNLDTKFEWKGKSLRLLSNSNKVNKSIIAVRGKVLAKADGIPLIIHNHYGKGETLFVNLNISRCDLELTTEIFRCIIENAGVSPYVQFLPKTDSTVRFGVLEKGDLTLLGVLMDHRPGKWNGGKVILPELMHVYDVKKGKYLGRLKEIKVTGKTEVQSAALFALQDECIKDVLIKVAKSVKRNKEVTIVCEVRAEGRFSCNGRVVRIQLRGPDGKLYTHYRRMAYLKNGGRGKAIVEFAINDPTGYWEVIATDIASGVTATTKVVLN